MHRERQGGAGDDRERQPEHHLVGGRPQVRRQQRAIVPQRLQDLGRRRGGGARPRRRGGRPPPRRRADRAATSAAVTARAPPARARAGHHGVVVACAWARQADVERRDDPAGPGREQHDAVREQHRLLDVVRHEQHRARLGRQRLGEPALHLQPRERVERPERLVQAQHGPPGQQRAQEGDALAHPARQRSGARALEALEAEGGEVLVGGGPRARARETPATRRASPALSSASSHGSRASRWGISAAGAARTRPASGAPSPHTSSSSVDFPQPLGPTTATISPGATRRVTPASARTAPNAFSTPSSSTPAPSTSRGSTTGASASPCIAPSAGITPQVRRVSAGSLGAISAGVPRLP